MAYKAGAVVNEKDKILYIEPNDLPAFLRARSANGEQLDNIAWDPDDLNISVDLQVVIPSREYRATDFDETGEFNLNEAKYQSILSGVRLNEKNKEGYLTTDWTSVSYQEVRNNRAGSKELFGINSIQITFDSHMYPRVTMNFTDVRGNALMEPQEQRNLDLHGSGVREDRVMKNFFVNFFKFPYPRFLLSVKGVYGTCVTFVLSVEDFKTTFNSDTGNFDTVVKFMGNMYGIYTDIPMNYLLIAPYIASKAGGFMKNEYWQKQTENEGAFFFNEDGHKGEPICTLLEFYSKYHTMIGPDGKGFGSAYGANLSELAEGTREISFLTGSDGIITKYFDAIPDNIRQAGAFVDGEQLGVPYNFIFFSKDIDSVNFVPDFIQTEDKKNGFKPSVEAYSREFREGYDNIFKQDRYNLSGLWKEENKTNCPTCKVDKKEKRILNGGPSVWSDVYADRIRKSVPDNAKCAFVYDNTLKTDVLARVEEIRDEQGKKMDAAQKEIAKFFKDMFGFSPTIENVMRMVFAHLDTFIHEFYTVISNIKGRRTLGSLKYPKELTDIESSSDESAHVPPYTAFFKVSDEKRVERIYPGDEKNLRNIAEVNFVNDIFHGIGSMKNWQDDFVKQYESLYGEQGDTDESSVAKMDFSGTVVSDIYYNGKNPYDSMSDSSLFPDDLYYFFLSRLYLYEVEGEKNNNEDEFARTEANNFINSDAFPIFKRKEGFQRTVKMHTPEGASFSFGKSYPIILRTNNGWTSNTGKTPMVFDGIEICKNSSLLLENNIGVLPLDTKYTDSDIEKFANVYVFNDRTKVTTAVNYADRTFSDDVTGFPIIPLTYSNGKYVPADGENTTVFPSKIKNPVKVQTDDGTEKDVVYGKSFDDMIKNAPSDSLWMPYVCYGKPSNRGDGQNLLLNYSENPILSIGSVDDIRFSAIYFIVSLLSGGKKDRNALNKLGANDFKKNTISCVQKIDFLVLCATAFLEKIGRNNWGNLDKKFPANKNPFRKLKSLNFPNSVLTKLSDYFKDWADANFSNIANTISRSTSVNKKETYKQCGSLKLSLPGTQLQSLLIDMFKETVYVITLSKRKNVMKDSDNKNAVKKFFSIVSEAIADNSGLSTEERMNITIDSNVETSSEMKSNVYYALKNLYDRWLCMETSETFRLYSVDEEKACRMRRINGESNIAKDRSEFLNFVYVDSFYNDISKRFLINPEKLFKLIGEQFDGEASYNVLDFIGRICQENKLLFKCLPVYSNIYNADTFSEIFTPHSLYDGTSRTGRRIGNTYLIMYTYEPSHLLDIQQEKSDGVNYGNDSFDIADSFGEITQESLEVMRKKSEQGNEYNYSICAFGVTPGKQNQSYFTKISVGMDNPRVTDFSIMNKFMLADMGKRGGTINGVGVGQDLYSVYSNRSYDCTVEMLGCANIMPMMYFQLNNVPMFKGTYMITKVEHNIQNNAMTTKFVGTRMPKRYIPLRNSVFSIDSISEAMNRIAEVGNTKLLLGNVNIVINSDGSSTTVKPGYEHIYGENVKNWSAAEESYIGKTFYRGNIEAQMQQMLYYVINGTPGYQNPIGAKSAHACATYVQYYLNAGFNGVIITNNSQVAAQDANIKRGANGFSGCNGYEMKNFLMANGFVVVATRSDVVNGTFEYESGDVCVMRYPNYGHVCMWSETQNAWVSDFKQATWHVGKEQSIGKSEEDVLVYRFGGTRSNEKFNYGERGIIKAKPAPNSCGN